MSPTILWTTHPATDPQRTQATTRDLKRPPLTLPGCPISKDSIFSNKSGPFNYTRKGRDYSRTATAADTVASLKGQLWLTKYCGVRLLSDQRVTSNLVTKIFNRIASN